MTKREIIERVATGLRNMKYKPDYILYSENGCYGWDWTELCGISVIYTDYDMYYEHNTAISIECPFLPVWKKNDSKNKYQSRLFFDGWDNWEMNDWQKEGVKL